jgi:hypothetical protein
MPVSSDRLTMTPETDRKLVQGEHQQLRTLLADTIGDAVLEEMDARDGFHRAGNPGFRGEANPMPTPTPAPVTPEATPASTANPTPVATPAPDATTTTETSAPTATPGSKKFLGKYNSEAEAEAGYHSLIRVNKTVLADNDRLAKELAAAKSQGTALATEAPRIEPSVRAGKRDEALKKIQANYAIDPEDMGRLADALAEETDVRVARIVDQRLADAAKPVKMYDDADTYLLARYPDAVNFTEELAVFAKGDAELKEVFEEGMKQGDLRIPMELSWLKFQNHLLNSQEGKVALNSEVRKAEVAQARKDAGLPSTQASGVHETPPNAEPGISASDFERLKGMWHAGYKEPLLRATIGRTLPDEVFGIQ